MLQLTIDHSHNRCGRKMLRPCFKLHLACAIIAAAELCVRRGNSFRGCGETRYLSERTEVLEGPLQVSSNHEVFSSREVQNLVD